jgi:hypothetical protein
LVEAGHIGRFLVWQKKAQRYGLTWKQGSVRGMSGESGRIILVEFIIVLLDWKHGVKDDAPNAGGAYDKDDPSHDDLKQKPHRP